MLPALCLHLAPLGQVNSLSCRDASWRHSRHPIPSGSMGKEATRQQDFAGDRAPGPASHQGSTSLWGCWVAPCQGSCVRWVSRGASQVGKHWEARGCCFTVSRQSSSLQPLARHQRSSARTAAGTVSVTGHSAVVLALLFARQKGQVEHPCPCGVGNPWQAAGTVSQ